MHHCVECLLGEQLVEQGAVPDVALDQCSVEHRIPVASAEVVQRGDVATLASQVFDHVGTDVTGTAGDQYAKLLRWHVFLLLIQVGRRCPSGSAPADLTSPSENEV